MVFKAFKITQIPQGYSILVPCTGITMFSYRVRVNDLLTVQSHSSVLAYDFLGPVFTHDLVFFAFASTASIYNKISWTQTRYKIFKDSHLKYHLKYHLKMVLFCPIPLVKMTKEYFKQSVNLLYLMIDTSLGERCYYQIYVPCCTFNSFSINYFKNTS